VATATIRIDERLARATLAPLQAALRGDETAARRYGRAWMALVRSVIEERPDVPAGAAGVLDRLAVTAPFAAGGPIAALLSAATAMMPDMVVPPPPVAATAAVPDDALAFERFARVVLHEVAGAGTGLEQLMAAWQLSVTDVGRLFGVARQAVQQWMLDGVPPARQPKLAVVLRIADLLEANLRPDRIPAAVRTPAEAYGGRSILAAIAAGDHGEVLGSVERAFDWSATS
jgi:hypothetical protein